jgi:SNF2 family DNA or RNA helicase
MNNTWWYEDPERTRVPWLGVFKRNLDLSAHEPKCLTIPQLKCIETGSFSVPNYCTGASLLFSPIIDKSGKGTVSLGGFAPGEALTPLRSNSSTVEERILGKLGLKTGEPETSLSKRLARLLNLSKNVLIDTKSVFKWVKKPFPYQIEGIDILLSRDALLLADDMGLGKTLQAIAALRILIYQKRIKTVLVIVPAGLISQWRKEIRLIAPELRISTVHGPVEERVYQWRSTAEIFLTSYETLRGDFTANPQSPPRRRIWDLVILDEAQKIKNRDAETSRKCKLLPRRRAWALTGTPLENKPDDLASILEFTRPLGNSQEPPCIFPGLEMRELHKNLQLRRRKIDVLPELPPKIISTVPILLLPKQRENYDRAEKEGILQLKEKGETVRITNVLELILRLKQICNFCPISGESSKLDNIEDKIHTLVDEGHRAIVFSQFTDAKYGVRAIYRRLKSLNPLVFTGDLNIQQKETAIRLFKVNSGYKILLLSLRAGGQGLNLQEASYVFHFDRWWNPAVERQAEDRSHRLGQIVPVHVYKYTCENTIEERIENTLRKKQKLFDELVDDVSIDIQSMLTEEDIFGLFGLTPPPKLKAGKQRGKNR